MRRKSADKTNRSCRQATCREEKQDRSHPIITLLSRSHPLRHGGEFWDSIVDMIACSCSNMCAGGLSAAAADRRQTLAAQTSWMNVDAGLLPALVLAIRLYVCTQVMQTRMRLWSQEDLVSARPRRHRFAVDEQVFLAQSLGDSVRNVGPPFCSSFSCT